jgi:hypothetical protein
MSNVCKGKWAIRGMPDRRPTNLQEPKACKYCYGTGYLLCSACKARGKARLSTLLLPQAIIYIDWPLQRAPLDACRLQRVYHTSVPRAHDCYSEKHLCTSNAFHTRCASLPSLIHSEPCNSAHTSPFVLDGAHSAAGTSNAV